MTGPRMAVHLACRSLIEGKGTCNFKTSTRFCIKPFQHLQSDWIALMQAKMAWKAGTGPQVAVVMACGSIVKGKGRCKLKSSARVCIKLFLHLCFSCRQRWQGRPGLGLRWLWSWPAGASSRARAASGDSVTARRWLACPCASCWATRVMMTTSRLWSCALTALVITPTGVTCHLIVLAMLLVCCTTSTGSKTAWYNQTKTHDAQRIHRRADKFCAGCHCLQEVDV